MVTAFAMRNFLKAAVGCLGMIAGCFSTGEAQDFGGMSFGEAGNFGPPQTSGSSKATVTSYGEASFVIVTELALPDHWHVYYKNPGTVGLPMEAAPACARLPGGRPLLANPGTGERACGFLRIQRKSQNGVPGNSGKGCPPGSDVHHHHDMANVRGTVRRPGNQKLQRHTEARRRADSP